MASAEVRHGAAHLPAGFEFFCYRVHLCVVSLALSGFQPQGFAKRTERLAFGSGRSDPRACFSLAARGSAGGPNCGETDRYCVTVNVADWLLTPPTETTTGWTPRAAAKGYCEVDLHDSDQLGTPIYVIELSPDNEKNNRDSIRTGLS